MGWNPAAHPRVPGGSSAGGQFKAGGGSSSQPKAGAKGAHKSRATSRKQPSFKTLQGLLKAKRSGKKLTATQLHELHVAHVAHMEHVAHVKATSRKRTVSTRGKSTHRRATKRHSGVFKAK